MRALIFIAAALATAGCNKADQAGNTANVDETVGAGSIASNDVTAIDAVTGEAANMAADVNLNSADENLGGNASSTASSNRSAPARRPAPATSSPAPATSNTTATEPATGNTAQ
jgi:hypothetical protein